MTSEEALQMASFIESSTEALSKQLDKYADHFPDPIWDNALVALAFVRTRMHTAIVDWSATVADE
jgi:hypothetical protein